MGCQQRFTVIVHAYPNSQFSPEGRKAFGLWFKEQREALAGYCAGVVRLVGSEEEGERVAGSAMQQGMPFPMVAVLTKDEALQWVEQKLAAEGAATDG